VSYVWDFVNQYNLAIFVLKLFELYEITIIQISTTVWSNMNTV